jgi:hypothetical protein
MDFVKRVAVPQFAKRLGHQKRLAELSDKAHRLKVGGKEKELAEVERKIDEAAAELWGITPNELGQIQKALKEE